MINFKNVGMTKDISWFAKRYNAFLVEFPKEITPEVLQKDDLCSHYDTEEVFEALKFAHSFLTSIATEMLVIPEQDEQKMELLEKVFSKIDLFWGICFYGELREEGNEYCLEFNKHALKNHRDTLPSSYGKSLENIYENGCYVEYFKNNKSINNYRSCSNGLIHFEDRLTALGIYIFIKKCAQKRWYFGDISEDPVKRCAKPYHRIDMRVFICGYRIEYNIYELLSGYNNDFIEYFKEIYDFVGDNYPDCLPNIGLHGYINCTMNFGVDANHRVIGAVGMGSQENMFGFYGPLTNKEMDTMLADIDSFGEKIVMQFMHDAKCDCELCQNKIGDLIYRGKTYNRIYKNTENRFMIENEYDVKQAIKCMTVKAECNMNTRSK